MFGRRKENTTEGKTAQALPPAPVPEAEKNTRQLIGTVSRCKPAMLNAYSYTHLAVIFDGDGEEAPFVLTLSSSNLDANLCEVGEKVKCSLYRGAPSAPWSLNSIEIVYDVDKERRAIENARRP
jgi:hypothetical protein